MISKISKSLTTALLLAVSFNNSYSMNTNNVEQNNYSYENNIDNIILGVNHINDTLYNIKFTNMQIDSWNRSSSEIKNAFPCNTLFTKLQYLQNNLVNQQLNLNQQIRNLFNLIFADNNDNISSLFESWDINLLKKLNDILHLPQFKYYVLQGRIDEQLGNDSEIKNIKNKILSSITSEIDPSKKLHKKYTEIINNIFQKYYNDTRNFQSKMSTLSNESNVADLRINMIREIKEFFTLYNNFYTPIAISVQRQKFLERYYYDNIINDEQIKNALRTNTLSYKILNNLKANNNVDTNIEQFFNNYIGDNYNLIYSNIFNIDNEQILDDINLILQDDKVKDYLAIGAIKAKLDVDIDKRRFFKGPDDPSPDIDNRVPASKKDFINSYLKFAEYFINTRKDKINGIRERINQINSNNNPIKQNIKNILKKCINNRVKYLDSRLQEIYDNLDNIYTEYWVYHYTHLDTNTNTHVNANNSNNNHANTNNGNHNYVNLDDYMIRRTNSF